MARQLYTFTVSHFSEKARWALDYKGVPYEEQRLVPGSHIPIVKRMARASTVPLLRDDGRIIQGSSAIIDYAEECWPEHPLTPAEASLRDQALELERWLDRELGEPLRRVFYAHAFERRDLVLHMFTQGGPWWGRVLCRAGLFVLQKRIHQMYAVTPENVALDRDRLSVVFERLESLLDDRRYLVGDHFSRADLALGALAAPLWDPPEHSTRWPAKALYPAAITALRGQFAETRVHEHVMRMYREHRRPKLGTTPGDRSAAGAGTLAA